MTENEQSLQRRPELVLERLMRGGLIVGVEQGIQGSLMSVTGAAIERITRERPEVPPQLKLPERAVYFLNPNTRRLIMISHRENRGENKTPDKYGLFAEIVELDGEGKPHYRLSSSEIILPNDSYQLVAVGPNSYGFPPSHIEVVEEGETEFRGQGIFERGSKMPETEAEKGKKRFVSWNFWLNNLQLWMNEVKINPGEDPDAFINRFFEFHKSASKETESKIRQIFPAGDQGINENTVPFNIIVTDKGEDSFLYKASFEIGLYPFLVTPKNLAEFLYAQENKEQIIASLPEEAEILYRYIPGASPMVLYSPALITVDNDACHRLYLSANADNVAKYHGLRWLIFELQRRNPIFSLVIMEKLYTEAEKEQMQRMGLDIQEKHAHGWYRSIFEEEAYRGLLNKLKADLLLTMFLRGGAPIVK